VEISRLRSGQSFGELALIE